MAANSNMALQAVVGVTVGDVTVVEAAFACPLLAAIGVVALKVFR